MCSKLLKMALCGKCSADIGSCKDVITCVNCEHSYHVKCTKVETSENLKKLTAKNKAAWKCDDCSEEDSFAGQNVIVETIQMLRRDLTQQISDVNSNVDSIKSQLKGINDSINGLQTSVDNLKLENESRISDIEQLKNEMQALCSELDTAKAGQRRLEQYSRADNVEINGVPYTGGEDVYALLDKIARVLNLKFNRYEISVAHRLRARPGYANPPIIVKFMARACKTAWINAFRSLRPQLTAMALHNTWPATQIYINDHLSPYFKALLYNARQLVKGGKLASAWSSSGKVWARKGDYPPVALESTEELQRLIKD